MQSAGGAIVLSPARRAAKRRAQVPGQRKNANKVPGTVESKAKKLRFERARLQSRQLGREKSEALAAEVDVVTDSSRSERKNLAHGASRGHSWRPETRAREAGERQEPHSLQPADAPQMRHRIGGRKPLRHHHSRGPLLPKLQHQRGKRADREIHGVTNDHSLTLGLDRAARNRAKVTQGRKNGNRRR